MLQTSVHFFDMIGKCHSTVSDVAQSFYKKAYKCKKAVYVLLKSTALVAVIITGLAGSTYGDEIALSPSGTDHQLAYDSHLPEVIIRSIYQDPAIRRSTARTCQAIYALGLRRAERRPEITAEVTGERELFSNFKRSNAHNDPSRAITRGYNSNLQEALEGVTSVFVTHRGGMVQLANELVVMDKGKIVMAGPKEQVLAKVKEAQNEK